MECNKEEAHKAKEIAEKLFTEGDFIGGKRFALKAQNLYPDLDGLSQLLATIEVYISAIHRIDGEIDWYRVLGVAPSADDETIRRHYRRLALVLHPDKNKTSGADEAFRIISEAWSVLSDNAKRSEYDQKRSLAAFNKNLPNWNFSVPAGQNGFHNFPNYNNANARTHTNPIHSKPSPLHLIAQPDAFWTICTACRRHFEYLKIYRNNTLLCPACRQPFVAVDVSSSTLNGKSSSTMSTPFMQGHNAVQQARTEYPSAAEKKPGSTTNMESAVYSGPVPSATSLATQAEKLKRKLGETLTPLKGSAAQFSNAVAGSSLKGEPKKQRRVDASGLGRQIRKPRSPSTETGSGNAARSQKSTSTRETLQLNLHHILRDKAKKSIFIMVGNWNVADQARVEKGVEYKEKAKLKGAVAINKINSDVNNCTGLEGAKTGVQANESSPANYDGDNSDSKSNDPLSMSVPDADFHDFDKDRTEKSFRSNQVWAAYDDDDGMPRYYALIHNVVSLKPFKVRMSWLNSKSTSEFGTLNWIDSGFYKTSGDFRIGKHVTNESLNSFSHKVQWMKGPRGTVQIYPRRGDVWALYKNWSPDWNEETEDEVIHQYDMVEVLEDYNQDKGVTVASLVKVAGFKAVFCREMDANKTRIIPREEMFRFSHQVPYHLLTGGEGCNSPKGCYELDPASTPLELLQVLTEIELEEMVAKAKTLFAGTESHKEEETVMLEEKDDTTENTGKRSAAENQENNKEKDSKAEKILVYQRRQ